MSDERKRRITVTVDPDLVQAGNEAISEGDAESFSGWVNGALVHQVQRDRRQRALRQAIAAYEAEFGEITDDELIEQARLDRANAIVVRGRRRSA